MSDPASIPPPEPEVLASTAEPTAAPTAGPTADLDRIEQDLADVESALSRLADGTYFVDEVTGAPISDDVLERNPLTRRAG